MSSRFLTDTKATTNINEDEVVDIVEDSNLFVKTVNLIAPDPAGNVTVSGGASNIGDLLDVTITTPVNNEVLTYSGGLWINQPVPSAPVTSVNAKTGVVVLDADDINETVTRKYLTSAERSMLDKFDSVQIAGSSTEDHEIAYDVGSAKFVAQDTHSSKTIGALSDVTITTPVNDQIMKYSAGTWINATQTLVGAIGDLSDVENTAPADKHVIIYDGVTDNRYENRLLVEADISDLTHKSDINSLDDCVVTAVADKHVMIYDGVTDNRFENRLLNGDDIHLQKLGASTYETVQHSHDLMASSGLVSGGVITDNLDSTISISSGKGYIRAIDDVTSTLYSFDIASIASLPLTDLVVNKIFIFYNAGTPIYQVDTVDRPLTTNIYVGDIYRSGTTLYIRQNRKQITVDHTKNIICRLEEVDGYKRISDGGALISFTNLNFSISQGTFYYGLNRFNSFAFNSQLNTFDTYYWNTTQYVFHQSTNTIDNLQYNDYNTGLLDGLGGGKYTAFFVFMDVSKVNRVVVLYSNIDDSLLSAQEVGFPQFPLPDFMQLTYIKVGKIIVLKSATSITETQSVFTDNPLSVSNLTLNNLADVNVTTPMLGDVIFYNNVSGFYENRQNEAQYVLTDSINTTDNNLERHLSLFHSGGPYSTYSITPNGSNPNTEIDITDVFLFMRETNLDTDKLIIVKVNAITGFGMNNGINYIYVEYNGASPQFIKSAVELADTQSNILIGTVYRDTILYIQDKNSVHVGDHAKLMSDRMVDLEGPYQRSSGLILAPKGTTLFFTVSSGDIWMGLNKKTIASFDSQTSTYELAYFNGSIWVIVNANSVPNVQYNNSGTLTDLSNNRFASHYVYSSSIDGSILCIYSYDEYLTEAEAELSTFPTIIPPRHTYFYKAIGKIIIQKNNTQINSTQSVFTQQLQLSATLQAVEISYNNSNSTTPLTASDVKSAIDQIDLNINNLTVASLSDTNISTPSLNHVLVFNASNQWENRKLKLDDLNQITNLRLQNGSIANTSYGWVNGGNSTGLYWSTNPIMASSGQQVQEWDDLRNLMYKPIKLLSGLPAVKQDGDIGYNSTLNQFEFYENGSIKTLSGGGASTLNDLTDVFNSAPADKHVLIYDGVTDNRYENRLLVKADISDLTSSNFVLDNTYSIQIDNGALDNPSLYWNRAGQAVGFYASLDQLNLQVGNTNNIMQFKTSSIDFLKKLVLTPVSNPTPSNNNVWIDSTTNRLHVYTNSKNVNLPPIISSTEADKHVMIYNNTNTQYENRLMVLDDLTDGESRVSALESNNAFTSDIEKSVVLAQDAVTDLTYDDTTKPISYIDLTVDTYATASDLKTNGDSEPYTAQIANIQDDSGSTFIALGDHTPNPRDWRINLDMLTSITTNAVKFRYGYSAGSQFINILSMNLYGSNAVGDYNTTDPGNLGTLTLIVNITSLAEDVDKIQTYANAGPYRYYCLIFQSQGQFGFEVMEVQKYQVRQIAGGLTSIFEGTDFLLNRKTDGVIEYKSIKSGSNNLLINVSNALDYVLARDMVPVIHDKKRVVSRSIRKQCYKNIAVAGASPYSITKDADGYINNAYALVDTTAAYTINLPDLPVDREIVMIYDYTGNASVQNITVNPSGSGTIDSGASYTMNINNQSRIFTYDSENDDWVSSATNPTNNIVIDANDSILLCDTTTTAFTMYLPASLTQGVNYTIKDKGGNAGTNNITVNPNSNLLDGFTTNKVINTNYATLKILDDGSEMWVI